MLLNIVLISIACYLITKGYSMVFAFQLVKDLAKRGYKFDIEQLNELKKNMPENIKTVNKMESYIPIYNVVKTIVSIFSFINNKEQLYEHMAITGLIREVDDFKENDDVLETVIRSYQNSENAERLTNDIKDMKEVVSSLKYAKLLSKKMKSYKKALTSLQKTGSKLKGNSKPKYHMIVTLISNKTLEDLKNIDSENCTSEEYIEAIKKVEDMTLKIINLKQYIKSHKCIDDDIFSDMLSKYLVDMLKKMSPDEAIKQLESMFNLKDKQKDSNLSEIWYEDEEEIKRKKSNSYTKK